MTKRRSGFGTGQKRMLPAARQNVGLNPQPMPLSQSRLVPFEALPGSRRGGANLCIHRREGGRDRQGVRGVRDLRQGRDGRVPRRSPISRPGKRVAAPCRVVQVRRDERGGPVGRQGSGRADAEDPRRSVLRTRKESFPPVDNGREPGRRSPGPGPLRAAGSGQTLRRAGRHGPVVEPRVCWKRRAVFGRKRSGRPWTREAETGEAVRGLARRGSASPRRGRRSVLARGAGRSVSRTRKAENA